MKVAVVGSRGLHVEDLGRYLPADTTEIVSGGAVGVDTSAREYALAHGLLLTEFRPDYSRYGRSANSQVLILIRDAIQAYEKEHGEIVLGGNSRE